MNATRRIARTPTGNGRPVAFAPSDETGARHPGRLVVPEPAQARRPSGCGHAGAGRSASLEETVDAIKACL